MMQVTEDKLPNEYPLRQALIIYARRVGVIVTTQLATFVLISLVAWVMGLISSAGLVYTGYATIVLLVIVIIMLPRKRIWLPHNVGSNPAKTKLR